MALSNAAICGLLIASHGRAADAVDASTAPATLQKPAWLTDLSIGIKESYDDNVFKSGVAPASATALQQGINNDFGAVPAGSVLALRNVVSAVTTVSPKVGVNFAPLLGDQKTLQVLALGYAPDFVTYHDAPTESYTAQRVAATVKWQDENWSFSLDDGFTYINGNRFGPTYPADLMSAWATSTVRERREQTQDRGTASLKYDQENWFVRSLVTGLDYNLETPEYLYPGYQNYINRYDVNGGLDVGYKIQPQFALTLGYRYGHQYQSEFTFAPSFASAFPIVTAHSPNDYQRVLVGFEGKPWKWLSASFQIGPDFRSFDASTPVNDKNPVKYYGEGALAATVSPKDTLAFKYKQWEWVSSTGLVPYFESTFDLGYSRKVTDALSLSLGARALGANYNPNNILANSQNLTINGDTYTVLGDRLDRSDWQYTLSAGMQYAFTANFSVNLAYSYDLGVNEQDGLLAGVNGYQPRGFNHQLVSLGMAFKF